MGGPSSLPLVAWLGPTQRVSLLGTFYSTTKLLDSIGMKGSRDDILPYLDEHRWEDGIWMREFMVPG